MGNVMKKLEREPIVLGKNTVALIQIFKKTDELEDLWWHSETFNTLDYKGIAEQFVSQLKDELCAAQIVAFAEVFKELAEEWTKEHPGRRSYEEIAASLRR
jgi:hypothetical protein